MSMIILREKKWFTACISFFDRNDVVPVAMGAHPDDYARSAPPNSFIHVEDFESPQHLARYLKVLDKNDELYNDYFKWKGTGDFIDTKFWCRLCAMLNDLNKPKLLIRDIAAWWRQPEVCIRGDQRWRSWCLLNLDLFVQFSPLQLKAVCFMKTITIVFMNAGSVKNQMKDSSKVDRWRSVTSH